MIPKQLSEVDASDLQELVTASRPEGRTIDYKSALPGNGDEDKRKLLYDVTALANTLGGDIVYGVKERVSPDGNKTGVPDSIIGVEVTSREREEQRLEAVVRSGVDPRIPGVAMRWVAYPSEQRPTLVMRVPKSILSPHMVVFGGMSRFYGRGTSGNFPMDVREIRAAFDLSGDLGKRLREFRAERLIEIHAGLPVKLEGTSRMVLHIVPVSSFEIGAHIDVTEPPILRLLAHEVTPELRRFNVDGHIGVQSSHGYVQVFRNGALEAVDCHLVAGSLGTALPSMLIERALIRSSRDYVSALDGRGARPPFFLALTLTGVQGYAWAVHRQGIFDSFDPPPRFDRDLILLPELLVDASDARLWSTQLKPLIDALWQAAGHERSQSYDATGTWAPGGGTI